MNPILRHTTIFLALLTLLLTACGRSAPTHFYLLDSGQPPLTADSLPAASLSIAPVSVPDYLDRNGLVRRSDGQTRLEVSELDIWAEPLGQGARRVLGEVLAARLLHLPLSLALFYLGLPQQAVDAQDLRIVDDRIGEHLTAALGLRHEHVQPARARDAEAFRLQQQRRARGVIDDIEHARALRELPQVDGGPARVRIHADRRRVDKNLCILLP